jgi:hypothetical protein
MFRQDRELAFNARRNDLVDSPEDPSP